MSKRTQPKILTQMRPAWLDVAPDNTHFVPNDGADIVRRIFNKAAAGLGTFVIATNLNRDGVEPLTGEKRHGEKLADSQPNPHAGELLSNGWNKGRVGKIIASDAVLGQF